jgi:hypothetical protein
VRQAKTFADLAEAKKQLGGRLHKFAAKFTCSLSSVSASQIHDFLLGLNVINGLQCCRKNGSQS